tara:strand:+ start:274 stop:660 length:387 start_codon:yes stop_codon:yes gene_type:complete
LQTFTRKINKIKGIIAFKEKYIFVSKRASLSDSVCLKDLSYTVEEYTAEKQNINAKRNNRCFIYNVFIFSRDIFGGFVLINAEKITKAMITKNTENPNSKSNSGFKKKFEFKPKNINSSKGIKYVVNK